jgi:hypothetical protein
MIDYVTHIPEAMVVNILTLHEIGDHHGTTVLDQIRSVARARVPSTRRRTRR